MSSRVTHVPLESVPQQLPTSGLGSSRSVLLGCMFCAMTMRARRSELVSVLAFRLQGAAERKAKHLSEMKSKTVRFHFSSGAALEQPCSMNNSTELRKTAKLSPLFTACRSNVQVWFSAKINALLRRPSRAGFNRGVGRWERYYCPL